VAAKGGLQPGCSHSPLVVQILGEAQLPQLPLQPSLPHCFPPQLGVQLDTHLPLALQAMPEGQAPVPQTPPHPSLPHCLPLQLRVHVVTHWPAVVHTLGEAQEPQLPPQPSFPHCLPSQARTQRPSLVSLESRPIGPRSAAPPPSGSTSLHRSWQVARAAAAGRSSPVSAPHGALSRQSAAQLSLAVQLALSPQLPVLAAPVSPLQVEILLHARLHRLSPPHPAAKRSVETMERYAR
jgi:hypothetical protein